VIAQALLGAEVRRIGPHSLWLGDAYALRPQLGWFDADVLDPPYLINASGGGHYRKRRPNFDQMMIEGLHRGFDHTVVNPLLCGGAVVFSNNDALADLLAVLMNRDMHRTLAAETCLIPDLAIPVLQDCLARRLPMSAGIGSAVVGEPRLGTLIAEDFGVPASGSRHGAEGDISGAATSNWGWAMTEIERWEQPRRTRRRHGRTALCRRCSMSSGQRIGRKRSTRLSARSGKRWTSSMIRLEFALLMAAKLAMLAASLV
jgi:hypothetical protein